MSYELDVLRALLRLSRRRVPATLEQILLRVGGEMVDVRRALAVLVRSGLVQQRLDGPRLSLAGLAVAVASASQRQPRRRTSIPPAPRAGKLTMPTRAVRRRRAA